MIPMNNHKCLRRSRRWYLSMLAVMGSGALAHCGGEGLDGPAPEAPSLERAEAEGPWRTGTFAMPDGPATLRYQLVDGRRMFDGDIVLPASEEELASLDRSTLSAGSATTSSRWPANTVVYQLQADLPTATRTRITDAINHWSQRTSIRFRARTTESAYVEFGDDSPGCFSNVGYTGGVQQINLASTCTYGNAIHEIGHTVGLWHEQSRSDRAGFLSFCGSNSGNTGVDYGLYDYTSVMQYPSQVTQGCALYDFWRRSSIAPAQDPVIAQWLGLSFIDRQGVEEMYSQGSGQSVAVGDFNGDGYRDVAIGAPRRGTNAAGTVAVYRGTPTGFVLTNTLYQATADCGAGDRYGASLASADFNNDGRADLAVGIPGEGGVGRVVVYLGAAGNTSIVSYHKSLDQTGLGANEVGDRFGYSLAGGDFDHDGYADLAVGTPGENWGTTAPSAGAVFLYRGGTTLTPWRRIGQSGLDTDEAGDSFGASLAVADLDRDGNADLAVGAPEERDGTAPQGGVVYLFRGGINTWRKLTPSVGATSYAQQDLYFGFSLSAGDFDGDTWPELAVGAPGATVSSTLWAGRVIVFRGTSTGPQTGWVTLTESTAAQGAAFGFSLAAGRVNNDVRSDLAVGAPGSPTSTTVASGRVFTYLGANTGLTASTTLTQSGLGSNEAGDRLGGSVAFGDFDSNGYQDLVAGANGEVNAGVQTGSTFAYRSNGTTLSAWVYIDP